MEEELRVLLGRLYDEVLPLLRDILDAPLEYPVRLLLDDELRFTEEEPVLRRTTSSFYPTRQPLDERTAPEALDVDPVRPVTTRTEELPVREETVEVPVREAPDALTELRLDAPEACESRRVEAPADVR